MTNISIDIIKKQAFEANQKVFKLAVNKGLPTLFVEIFLGSYQPGDKVEFKMNIASTGTIDMKKLDDILEVVNEARHMIDNLNDMYKDCLIG